MDVQNWSTGKKVGIFGGGAVGLILLIVIIAKAAGSKKKGDTTAGGKGGDGTGGGATGSGATNNSGKFQGGQGAVASGGGAGGYAPQCNNTPQCNNNPYGAPVGYTPPTAAAANNLTGTWIGGTANLTVHIQDVPPPGTQGTIIDPPGFPANSPFIWTGANTINAAIYNDTNNPAVASGYTPNPAIQGNGTISPDFNTITWDDGGSWERVNTIAADGMSADGNEAVKEYGQGKQSAEREFSVSADICYDPYWKSIPCPGKGTGVSKVKLPPGYVAGNKSKPSFMASADEYVTGERSTMDMTYNATARAVHSAINPNATKVAKTPVNNELAGGWYDSNYNLFHIKNDMAFDHPTVANRKYSFGISGNAINWGGTKGILSKSGDTIFWNGGTKWTRQGAAVNPSAATVALLKKYKSGADKSATTKKELINAHVIDSQGAVNLHKPIPKSNKSIR